MVKVIRPSKPHTDTSINQGAQPFSRHENPTIMVAQHTPNKTMVALKLITASSLT